MIRALVFLMALLLAGCAGMKLPPAPQDGFSANGRVIIRSGSESHYANFGWQAEPQTDRLSLGNPLGQTLAELEIHYLNGIPSYAVLHDADGRAQEGAPEALLRDATGMRLPVAGLRWWLQGVAAPGPASSRATADGQLIEQDGWRILASDFSQTQPVRRGPRKIELTRGEVSVRIVISEWQWQTLSPP